MTKTKLWCTIGVFAAVNLGMWWFGCIDTKLFVWLVAEDALIFVGLGGFDK